MSLKENAPSKLTEAEVSSTWRNYMDIDATYGGDSISRMAMSYETVEADAAIPEVDQFEVYAAALEVQSAFAANTAAAKVIEAATGLDLSDIESISNEQIAA